MIKGITNFLKKSASLKKVKRSGWRRWVGIENPESVAEHSFMCAIIAMCIADLKGLDTGKLMRMLLLHDLQEAVTGDYDYFAKKGINKKELKKRNHEAIIKMIDDLPKKLKENYLSLWIEFEKGETVYAKIARQIDQLELIFQALEYEKDGFNKRALSVFWEKQTNKLEDENLRQMFDLLEKERI